MIVVSVMGGLGNQMQQYALYRKLKDLGKDAKLDTSWFLDEKAQEKVLAPRSLELSRFVGLPMDVATKQERDALAGTGS
ncbi:MAG TPA: alpha-1,2-fucosyltransferase, partial [Lachnospiraceae bacterium]|nr:alpha-1,2-fucosyltransferase [Lachnospiraceae bacterium]